MKYLICNLKANKTYEEILEYKEELQKTDKENLNFILAPSNIYLPLFKNENVLLSVQDISLNDDLHLTGDISSNQLKSLNVKYALIGHYERRKYYNEKESILRKKIDICLKNNIKVIYCIGETLEELNRKVEYQVLEKELANVLNYIPKEQFKNIIIAYEPGYLIGSNTIHDLNKINEMISFIKKLIKDYYNEEIDVVFGGNVNENNIEALKKLKIIDGFLIGTSSLNPSNIKQIITKSTVL